MQNTIIHLLGHWGVGKLTVARAICAASDARLFDNHLSSNVVISLLGVDSTSELPDRVWDYVGEIRVQAYAALEELAPKHLSYVFTNTYCDIPRDRVRFSQILDLVARRDSTYVPVILRCEDEENARRIVQPDRHEHMKYTYAEGSKERKRTHPLLPIQHKNLLMLDITHILPESAAQKILDHTKACIA